MGLQMELHLNEVTIRTGQERCEVEFKSKGDDVGPGGMIFRSMNGGSVRLFSGISRQLGLEMQI
jgi:hypothetical protein